MNFSVKNVRLIGFLAILCLISFKMSAQNLQAYFDYKAFQLPPEGYYIETHLLFVANSLRYQKIDEQTQQASVELEIFIKSEGEIIDFQKLQLESPLENTGIKTDFINIQRFALAPGIYEIEISIKDLYAESGETQQLSQIVELDANTNRAAVSDITLIKAYSKAEEPGELTKSGYDLIPYVSTYLPSDLDALIYYVETYHSDNYFGEGTKYLLESRLINQENGKVLDGSTRYKRMDSAPVSARLEVMDISLLPTGNYKLEVSVNDPNKKQIASNSIDFYRNNFKLLPDSTALKQINIEATFVLKYSDRDTLLEHLRSLSPISSPSERNTVDNQLQTSDLTTMQRYFYNFWQRRDPVQPEKAWNEYHAQVKTVQEAYGTHIKKGYATDRGRVYLQYGPPNTMVKRYYDSDAFPYEIWHYYHIGKFNNKRFLFWNRDLVGDNFELLQSDVPGEVKNPRWNILIFERNNVMSDINNNKALNENARLLEELYNNPR